MSSFQPRLTGSWKLIHYKATSVVDPNDIVYPLGKDCRGRAIYSPDGYISAHIQSSSIQAYSGGRYAGTKDELADAAKKTLTYTGAFRLEEDEAEPTKKATVYYNVEISMPTNWVGTTEVRELEIVDEGGESYLYLRPPGTVDVGGVQRKVEVKTVKARDNANKL